MIRLLLVSLLFSAIGSAQAASLPRVAGEPVWATTKSSAALALRNLAWQERDTASLQLRPLERSRVEEAFQLNSQSGTKVLQVGIHRATRDEALGGQSPRLTWAGVADGGKTARLVVSSPNARALRVGLNISALPNGAELRFASALSPANVVALATAAEISQLRRESPVYWTPVTDGDSQIIEIYLPAGADSNAVRLEVESTSHLFSSPADGFKDVVQSKAAGSCNRNVVCEPQTQGLLNAKNAVARMVYTAGCGSNGAPAQCLCTGTLLNDTDASTQIPYFFSANHCIGTQTEASTLNTFWFYEASTCGAATPTGSVTLAGGATLLYKDTNRDVLLLKLNNPPPVGAFFSGWDANTLTTGTQVKALHHPQGDVKKISLGQMTGFTMLSELGGQEFATMAWTSGTTEGGSSGSGVFTVTNDQYFLRGGLYGGFAQCSNSGSVTTASNRDYYSRIDQAYSNLRLFLEADYTGAWANLDELGWGLSIARGDTSGALGIIMYHFGQNRQPIWYNLSGGTRNNNVYTGPIYFSTGPWLNEPFMGVPQTLAQVGTVTITFNSPTTATMAYTLTNVGSFTKQITKLNF